MKKIIPVVAACILKQHPLRILLHKKNEPRNPELLGKWEFPGGMMEYGEQPEQALEREIGEELNGVIIQVNHLIHARTNIHSDGHYLILYFICQTSYEPAPDGCHYFAHDEIQSLDCIIGTKEVADKIAKGYK